MKIVCWNCNGAFRKKISIFDKADIDLFIIQECEHPSKFVKQHVIKPDQNVYWFGDDLNKGLGIIHSSKLKIEVDQSYNPAFKHVIPIKISYSKRKIHLLAIWANNKEDLKNRYVGQVWKAIHHYETILRKKNIILAGDFNSNAIWDRKGRIGNHSDVVAHLKKRKINSLYHLHHLENHGSETIPTFYLYKNKSKPYHLDYVFLSDAMHQNVTNFEIGSFEEWKPWSDHVPITLQWLP